MVADIGKLLPEFHDLDRGRWRSRRKHSRLLLAKPGRRTTPALPPQRSYERACKGAELFAFVWESARFGRRMYLKICFMKETLYIVSFHPAKFAKESEP